MDRQHFAALTKALKSAYPNFKIIETREGFELWYKALHTIPGELSNKIIYNHIMKNKYPPAISDIISAAENEIIENRTAALMGSRQKQIKGPQRAALGSRE